LCIFNFRAAALRCRQKKKSLVASLENKVEELHKVNVALEVNYCNYYNCFTAPWTFSWTTWVSQYQKGKTNLDLLVQEIVSGNGISWAICKSAPRPRQITMPESHHTVFYRSDALPAAQPTVSKH